MEACKPDRWKPGAEFRQPGDGLGLPLFDRPAIKSAQQEHAGERALRVDGYTREQPGGQHIQEHALERQNRKEDKEAGQTR